MIDQSIIQVGVLLVVALIYAVFDVFNKRNIPDFVVYATIIVGIAIAVLYSYNIIILDFGIAAAVGIIGFFIYRAGFLGAGDVLELVFISLVFPIQGLPYYLSIDQIGMPFVLSVIIAAGYTATVFIPLYYILGKRLLRGKKLTKPTTRNIAIGGMLLVAYIAFAIVFSEISSLGSAEFILIMILALASFISLVYEMDVYKEMTALVYPSELERGDMVALNLMDPKELEYFKAKYKDFGRLVTFKMIHKLKGVKKKIPIYRDSVPFSLFILLGVVISLAFGNLILILIGI